MQTTGSIKQEQDVIKKKCSEAKGALGKTRSLMAEMKITIEDKVETFPRKIRQHDKGMENRRGRQIKCKDGTRRFNI